MEFSKHGGDIYSHFDKFGTEPLDFSSNLNLLGMPKNLLANFNNMHKEFSKYPDTECRELVSKISCYENVDFSNILCGNGAAELIFALANALKPKKALIPAPTFSEYELSLRNIDCKIDYLQLSEQNGFKLDLNLVKSNFNNHNIMYLCSPNNPTGRAENKSEIIKIIEFLKSQNCILVLDQCFVSFLTDEDDFSLTSELSKHDNLIILKAFTKIFSLAGIRLGYMLTSNAEILSKTRRAMQAWSVSAVAQICGSRALDERGFIERSKEVNRIEREYLCKNLSKFPLKIFNPQANYIFFKCLDDRLSKKLESRNILIRSCENYIGLSKNFYRIAVKDRESNDILIKNLEEIFNG